MANLRPVRKTAKKVLSKRERIENYIVALPKGKLFKSATISKIADLSGSMQAAGYLSRRDDVEWAEKGWWRKI